MIDDILKEIRDAEDKADEIIKDANQRVRKSLQKPRATLTIKREPRSKSVRKTENLQWTRQTQTRF